MPRVSLLTREIVPIPEGAVLPFSLSPTCFGCGPENERGLQLECRLEGDLVVADLELVPWQGGGPGVAHGGILAAFLDELMGHVAVAHRLPAVTARFEIDYLRPVPIGRVIRGEAWLARVDGRKLLIEGEGRVGGDPLIEARSLYMSVGLEHFGQGLSSLSAEQLERLARFQAGEVYP